MNRSSPRQRSGGLLDAVDLDAELIRIAATNIEELREMWRDRRKQDPPAGLSKDIIARALAYWLQEERLGGLEPPLRRLLAAVAQKSSAPARRLKAGSIIVREYQGKMHEVLVVPDGFCWQGHVYASLSAVALKITGTNWNGLRFFGLRSKKSAAPSAEPEQAILPRAAGERLCPTRQK